MTIRILTFLLALSTAMGAYARPTLSFFNEMKGQELKALFSDSTLITTLVALKAEIRMGMLDFSPERADVLKKLNTAGIPVVAWLLLPEEEGYWFHSGNGMAAIRRYEETKTWAAKEGILFKGIGIDLELDMQDVRLAQKNPWALIRKLPGRLYDKESIINGHRIYDSLINMMKADGFPVESYYASFIKDETANGTTSIQQLTGFLDIKTEKEIPMIYTSFTGNPDGFLKVVAIDPGLKQLALGSTGGGVDTTLNTLTWNELEHDLKLAATVAEEIHIFSLEGCVQKKFLSRLVDFDYKSPPPIQQAQVEQVKSWQRTFIGISTVLSYPTLLFAGIVALLGLLGWGLYRLFYFLYRKITRT